MNCFWWNVTGYTNSSNGIFLSWKCFQWTKTANLMNSHFRAHGQWPLLPGQIHQMLSILFRLVSSLLGLTKRLVKIIRCQIQRFWSILLGILSVDKITRFYLIWFSENLEAKMRLVTTLPRTPRTRNSHICHWFTKPKTNSSRYEAANLTFHQKAMLAFLLLGAILRLPNILLPTEQLLSSLLGLITLA